MCTKYKILGIVMNNKLTWNHHVDYIMKKSLKKHYSLMVLHRAGVEPAKILKVHLTTVRSVMDRNIRYLYGKPGGVVVISRASHLYDPGSSPHVG